MNINILIKYRNTLNLQGRCVLTGASTPYKRWSKCTMEKVRGGKVFAAFFQEFRGVKIRCLL